MAGMRNLSIADVDDADRDVLPVGTAYPPGQVLERHEHRRAQLLYGATGVMVLTILAMTALRAGVW